jgi:xanthine dehydrogenase iron-sulfur cluster and FAD-binding subunit A
MIPAKFDYLAPTSVEDALSALAEHGDDAKIMAGGQSLLPVLRMRLNAPEVVIDIGRIDSLRGIRDDGDAVVIGALRQRRWRTTRSGTGAPSAGRWHTPTRPATWVPPRSHWARSS